jgi:uncharacterized RDD family membrane protein YckC
LGLKNMGSPQFDLEMQQRQAATGTDGMGARPAAFDLRSQAAARIAAHRNRRAKGPAAASPGEERRPIQPHNRIAAAVAERYAQTPSYRAVLAEQAQRAIDQAAREAESAAAEAEIAARNAHAVAEAQNQLLAELELWNAPQDFAAGRAEVLTPQASSAGQELVPPASRAPVKEVSTAGLTVRLYEDIGTPARGLETSATAILPSDQDAEEARALDEEIAFRQGPLEPFDLHHSPIAANLLEFPRQLVAARRVRPRLAEGPLMEEAPRSPQLRIFEVEAEQIATAPVPAAANAPEWAGILLDAQPMPEPAVEQAQPSVAASTPPLEASYIPIEAAPLELRSMAACVDLLLVGFAFLAVAGIGSHCAHRVPTGVAAVVAAACTYAVLWPLYQLLFFTFSDQTPGMRYARIGLCTFSNENPTRSAIRRRILAQAIAVCPLGIGILWALLDAQGIGWHDRMSRMYQRGY